MSHHAMKLYLTKGEKKEEINKKTDVKAVNVWKLIDSSTCSGALSS